ncbi:MAG: LPS export ABC transporter periplasmic protein LptC [Ignavibacteriae bacterium]|nr:LPS export ABC transporter periplasmic protein LptC [Ignavibacteriota bacterium]
MARWIRMAGIGLLLAIASYGCEDKIKPSVLPGIDSSTLPQQESWNSKIVVSDSGRVKAVIYAGYLMTFQSPAETHMREGIIVHFYDDAGVESSVLTANEGIVNDITKNLEASGNVLVVSSDSTELRTEKLYWDNRKQLIHTPEFVRINSTKERLQGFGFESDQHLRSYRIFRVSGETVPQ